MCAAGIDCSRPGRSRQCGRGAVRRRWARRFGPSTRTRSCLPLPLPLPPSPDDRLSGDHLARFVADLVDEVLDLSPVLADYGSDTSDECSVRLFANRGFLLEDQTRPDQAVSRK
ncbi:hypothetical protein ACE1SV_75350 [Streptomyces sennicomposti]